MPALQSRRPDSSSLPVNPRWSLVRYGFRVAAITGVAIGGVWLAAWLAGVAPRWSAAGALTMKANMALGQALAGAALLLLGTVSRNKVRRLIGVAAAVVVLLIGSLTFSEHLFHYNLGIDQILATEAPGALATASPNRMGLPGSSSLALLGAGLLALAWRRRSIAAYFGLGVCLVNVLPAVGFLYGIDQFYNLPRTGIAWPSVVALMSLGLGVVVAHPDSKPMAMLLRDDAGGAVLRRLLPAALLLPLVLGLVRVLGERRGLYDTPTGTGFFAIAMTVVFSFLLWRSAAHLSRTGAEQAEAERAGQESAHRYRSLFENMLDGFAYCKMLFDGRGQPVDFVYLDVNHAFEKLTGLENVIGKKVSEVIPGLKQSNPELFEIYGRVALTGEPERFEIQLKPLRIWLSVAAYSTERESFVAVFDNVTARKRAEEELAGLASFPKLNPYPITELDRAGRVCYLNPAAQKLFPDLDEKRLEHAWLAHWEFVVRAVGEEQTKIHFRDISVGGAQYLQTIYYVPDTERIRIYGLDITERKRAEQELQKVNRTLKAVNNSNQSLLRATDEATLLEELCRIITQDCGYMMAWIGYAEQDEGKTVRPVAHSGFDEGYLANLRITWADDEYGRGPTGIAIRSGRPCMCRNMLTDPQFEPWRDEALKRGYASSLVVPLITDGKAFGAISIYSREPDAFSSEEIGLLTELAGDVAYGVGALRARAAHEKAEKALRQSQERLAAVVGSAMDAIITVDQEQRIVMFNAAAENIFACSASLAVGQQLDRFIPERFREIHRSDMRQFGETGVTSRSMNCPGRLYGLRADGREFPIEATISHVTVAGQKLYTVILRDIARRKQTEAALLTSEKLATVGRLAATVAHEINNPLAAVTNLLYLAQQNPGLDDSVRAHLQMADAEVKRAAQIAKQTLGFSKGGGAISTFRPTEVLDNLLLLCQAKLRNKEIQCERDFKSDVPVSGVESEIRQVFWNLFSNSIDAVPTGGRIKVRVSTSLHAVGVPGVRMTIGDNGYGISAEHLPHLFEPFFTTKHTGNGLGLWITSQIVNKHGGSIRVRSRAGRGEQTGTVFSVFFPAQAQRAEGQVVPAAEDQKQAAIKRAV